MNRYTVRLAAAFIAAALSVPGTAQADELLTFELGTRVCDSPQSYDQTVDEQTQAQEPAGVETVQREQRCIVMGEQQLRSLQVPLVTLLERQNGKAKVSFVIKHRQQRPDGSGEVSLVRYIGWTAADNLKPYFG